MTNEQDIKQNNDLVSFSIKLIIAPGMAGIIDRTLFHGLDLIINTQQVQNLSFYQSIKYIHQIHGFRGFYKGFKWSLYGSIPDRISMYGSYYTAKNILSQSFSSGSLHIVSGVISGAIDATIVTPFEAYRVRINNQIQVSSTLKANFRGYSAVLSKCIIANTFSIAASDWAISLTREYNINHPILPFTIGFFAGAATQVLVTPIDNIKSKMMIDYEGRNKTLDIIKSAYKNGRLYNSFWSRTLRISLGTSVMIGIIDRVNETANKFNLIK